MSIPAQPLRYLIGRDADPGEAGAAVTELGYDATTPPKGMAIKYGNLRDQVSPLEMRKRGTGYYGPYLELDDDIQRKYDEPAPDPSGEGFRKLVDEQLDAAVRGGWPEFEWDNPDTYDSEVYQGVINKTAKRGMLVALKNPNLVEGDKLALIRHHAASRMIIEHDKDVTAGGLHKLRSDGGKPDLPVHVVTHGDQRPWAQQIANQAIALGLKNFSVTHSPGGEYTAVDHILLPTSSNQPVTKPMTLAQKIVAAAERRGAPIDRKPGEINIIYVEGIDADGTPNRNRVNAFDDLRCVIDFVNGEPRILGSWEATTAPGERYTKNPINDDGAAIIALGHQRAWQVGMHPMSNPNHKALVQTGGSVRVARDKNKDYTREGDIVQAGWFGINQHWGYDQPRGDIGSASAGCLVGRTKDGHREFMKFVESDPRYLADSKFVFGTTVITARDVAGDVVSDKPATGFHSMIGGFFSSPDRTDLPASIRFNNPGAVNAVAWNKALPGYVDDVIIGGGNNIACYYTPEQGTAMYWELLRRYASGGTTTVGGIIDKYGGGQNYSKYKSFVTDKTGYTADTEIDLDDDAQLLPFAKAMFHYEAGRATPLSDAQIIYGFDYARNGFKPPVDEPEEPDDEPTDEPDDGEPLPDMTDIDAAISACEAKMAKAIDELRAEVKRIEAKKPPPAEGNDFDFGAIPEQLIPVMWPVIQKLSADQVLTMLKGFKEAKGQGLSTMKAAILAVGAALGGGGFTAIIAELLSRFGGG